MTDPMTRESLRARLMLLVTADEPVQIVGVHPVAWQHVTGERTLSFKDGTEPDFYLRELTDGEMALLFDPQEEAS